ncbi:alcohol acetyltransferase-domain-containing protein [Daedaleopsis nitida]|nr:alcohol acetyltransferase-domain-containing protein [Daedaleopsis nitida]
MTSSAAAFTALAEVMYVARHCIVGSSTFLLYDYVITLGQEVELFWRHQLTAASFLFFANRYVTVFFNILGLAALAPFSNQRGSLLSVLRGAYSLCPLFGSGSPLTTRVSCQLYVKAFGGIGYFQYIVWAAFSGLRAFALSRHRPLSTLVFLLMLVPAGMNYGAQFAFGLTGVNDPILGCITSTDMPSEFAKKCARYDILVITTRACIITGDAILVGITWMTLAKRHPVAQMSSRASRWTLSSVLLRDGVAYFIILLILNVLHLTFTISSVFGHLLSNISLFTDEVIGVLVSRFLLDLQAASQKTMKLNSDDPLHFTTTWAYNDGPERLEELFRRFTPFSSYVVVAARYESASGAPLNRPVLFAALDQTIRTHTALAAQLPLKPSPPTWIQLPSVDLNRIVTFYDDKTSADLPALFSEILTRPFSDPDDLPLWRLLVLRDGMLVFAYDHCIGDGQSGFAFHHTLLEALNDISGRREGEGVPAPSGEHSGIVSALPQDVPLSPPLEEAIDISVPLPMALREFANELFPFLKPGGATEWTGNPVPKTVTHDASIRIFHYTPEDTAKLIKVSRDHRTTLTGTVQALALISLSRLLHAQPVKGRKQFKSVSAHIPISLRRYTGVSLNVFCNHVSTYNDRYKLPPASSLPEKISVETFPWAIAADITETLRRKAPRAGRHIGLIKFISGRYDEFIRGRLGKRRSAGLELSNIGAFPRTSAVASTADVQWSIRETLFTQADATTGGALKVYLVGSPTGGVGLTVSWPHSAVEDGLGEKFATAIDEGLHMLVG